VKPINVRDAAALERDVTSFAGVPNSGLLVIGSAGVSAHQTRSFEGVWESRFTPVGTCCKLREQQPDPVRSAILDRLERILSYRTDLIITARREGRCWWRPRVSVWWVQGKPVVYDNVRRKRDRFSKNRDMAIPAAWVLARLGGKGSNTAVRVRKASALRPNPQRERAVERLAIKARNETIRLRRERKRKRRAAMAPAALPDTLGWRGWRIEGDVLVSPLRGTPWPEAILLAGKWSDSRALRGVAGIHARRVPRGWRLIEPASIRDFRRCDIHGIVERFGRYVLGKAGWRAEWAVIRELVVPDTQTALKLVRRYPEVRIHVREQEAIHEDR
jgi:hypothetical protein